MRPKIETGRGVIALLDALGMASFTQQEASKFISETTSLIEELESRIHKYKYVMRGKDGAYEQRESAGVSPKTLRFGDTILVTPRSLDGKSRDYPNFGEHLQATCQWTKEFIALALAKGYRFRGAIAYGQYSTNWTDVFVGPVVADAASWYEEPRMIGAMLTPTTFKSLVSGFDWREGFDSTLCRYYRSKLWNVRTKHRGEVRTLLVDWPSVYSEKWFKEEIIGEHLEEIEKDNLGRERDEETNLWDGINQWYAEYDYITGHNLYDSIIPYGTEDIYSNTLDFVIASCRDMDSRQKLGLGAGRKMAETGKK